MREASRVAARLVLIAIALATIGCDRMTKHVASAALAGMPGRSYLADTVWLGYVENPGGFLSLGAGLPPGGRMLVFTAATGLALAGLLLLALGRQQSRWPALGLTLFIAGGASNWIDRVATGRVVDFINLGIGPVRTGVFNVADVAIMAGALLFVVGEYRSHHRASTVTRQR
jgi:signal peptidase II